MFVAPCMNSPVSSTSFALGANRRKVTRRSGSTSGEVTRAARAETVLVEVDGISCPNRGKRHNIRARLMNANGFMVMMEKAPRAAHLTYSCALGIGEQRVNRSARGHQQTIAMQAAEAKIGAAFGEIDAADPLAIAVENDHAIEAFGAHAPAAPEIAVHVHAHSVGRAILLGCDQLAHARQPRAAICHVIDPNVTR